MHPFFLTMRKRVRQITYDCSNVSLYERNAIIEFCFRNCYRWNFERLIDLKRFVQHIPKLPNEKEALRELNNAFHFGIAVNRTVDVMENPINFKDTLPVEVYFITDKSAFSSILDKDHLVQIKNQFKIKETQDE